MSCNKVILFYESHDNPITTKIINSIIPAIKNSNIKSICFEESSDLTRSDAILRYQRIIKNSELLEEPLVIEQMVKNILNADSTTVGFWEDETMAKKLSYRKYKKLPESEKKVIQDAVKGMYLSHAQPLKDALKLVEETNDTDLHYCSFDYPSQDRKVLEAEKTNSFLDKRDIRNEYMKQKILEQCENKGDVLLIVGAGHFKLAQALKKSGVSNVEEYYIVDYPPVTDIDGLESNCLRPGDHSDIKYCSDYVFKGLFLDLNADPKMDLSEASQVIGLNILVNNILQENI